MDDNGKSLIKMDQRMFAAKQDIDLLHQSIAENFYPERADFTQSLNIGDEFASHIIDAKPVLIRRELGDQIGSMVRPSDRQWFKASTPVARGRKSSETREFLEFMTDTTRAVLYSRDDSGFRRAAKELENDFVTFGIGFGQVSYSKDRSNLMFRCHHPKDCAGSEGPDGIVDHVHRRAMMSPRKIKHFFGESGRLPQNIKDAIDKGDEKKDFLIRHIVIPAEKYDSYKKMPKSAKWVEVYVAPDGTVIQELPAATFDYIVMRWQTISGQFWPFSPATIVALPQARMLQTMMGTIINAAELRVRPPMIATADVVTSPISLKSADITYIDREYDERLGSALRPLDLGSNLGLGMDMVASVRDILTEAFYINKLAPIANRDKAITAYEASQLVQEYIRVALPLFEPIEDEWTSRVLDLSTEKIMRAGGFGQVDAAGVPLDMPDDLLGESIEFEFNNSLKEARSRQVIDGFVESSRLIDVAAAIDPAVVSEVSTSDMFRDAFSAVPGSKSNWLKDEAEAADARAATEQQAADRAALEQVAQGAEAVQGAAMAAEAVGA